MPICFQVKLNVLVQHLTFISLSWTEVKYFAQCLDFVFHVLLPLVSLSSFHVKFHILLSLNNINQIDQISPTGEIG